PAPVLSPPSRSLLSPPPHSPPFPYTTLFRSAGTGASRRISPASAMPISSFWSFMFPSSRNRAVASTLLCPRHPARQPEAVRPPILHRQQHKNRKEHHKPQQSAILRPQMHKEQERQPGLDERHYHHAHQHLRRVNILIGNDELKPCKGQYAKVDDQVFPNSTTLMFFGGSHSHMLRPRSISVRQVQQI